MRLLQLVKQLPVLHEAPPLARDFGAAFDTAPEVVPRYVEPTVTQLEWPLGARVILVEAPGAVGKSAAAAALARATRWPLIRAEKTRVAAHSLSGLVGDALGTDSDYIQRIPRGLRA